MVNLVIVESPAKCSKIQQFLGPGWKCTATFGHIRALQEDLDAIGLDRDFEAKYMFLKEKAKSIATLKEAAKGADTIYLASDDDREGEAISYAVALLLGLNPTTTPRAVFREITATAVKHAVANPRRIDMNRVNAQQARSILDMMVGFTISPLLWSFVGPALSAGRCQTPALRLLCEKEEQIKGFSSQTVWKLRGEWQAKQGSFAFPAVLKDELEDKESAVNFLENIHTDMAGTVFSATTKQWSESPPKPLITSTLQQECSALYSIPPKKTMSIAQKLYEQGHITYMRTDHPVLSDEAKVDAEGMVTRLYGDTYIGVKTEKKTKPTGKEGVQAQEAHEAIRPTHFETVMLTCDDKLDALDNKVYRLIWARSMQSVMAAAKGDERVTVFVADGDPGEFPWEAKWKRTTFPGWRKVGVSLAQLDETEAAADLESVQATWIQAISLREGDKVVWKTLEAAPVTSKPPPRYNEATLVRELEKKGIGRPSTYASLVGTLLEKKYAEKKDTPATPLVSMVYVLSALGQWPPKEERVTKQIGAEKDKMIPTPLGTQLLAFCLKEFKNLFEYDFTAQMETRLDRIASGLEPWKQVCHDTWNSYKDHYADLKTTKKGSKGAELKAERVAQTAAKVKEFADGVKAVIGRKGPVLLREDPQGAKDKTTFYGWPDGVEFTEMTEELATHFIYSVEHPAPSQWGSFQGHPIVIKKGPHGSYAQAGSINVNVTNGMTAEELQQKFQEKSQAKLHTLGDFEFRQGQYGPFMYKKEKGGKKPQFVSLPENLDPKTLTLEAAERIYTNGLQQKSAARGGSRGRGGGRGRGRGRGGSTA
jgi:DNA topoisomerase I